MFQKLSEERQDFNFLYSTYNILCLYKTNSLLFLWRSEYYFWNGEKFNKLEMEKASSLIRGVFFQHENVAIFEKFFLWGNLINKVPKITSSLQHHENSSKKSRNNNESSNKKPLTSKYPIGPWKGYSVILRSSSRNFPAFPLIGGWNNP